MHVCMYVHCMYIYVCVKHGMGLLTLFALGLFAKVMPNHIPVLNNVMVVSLCRSCGCVMWGPLCVGMVTVPHIVFPLPGRKPHEKTFPAMCGLAFTPAVAHSRIRRFSFCPLFY